MNIRQAKEEIRQTLRAYLAKEDGHYLMPVIRQRPLLLMGAPGIGKTAVIEQIAEEEKVALVSYTITHHTRQSAIGLPLIREREYDGTTYSATEYTMSEIIASIYERMQETGQKEGILFLDEINCVSETLAPIMLQFLQEKKFGNHRVPEGWVIITAGNPPEYNKSAREFDVVTLDRIRVLEIDADFPAWKTYAFENLVNPAIISYLELKQENFYRMETTTTGRRFVTARGWEDLSVLMGAYERLGLAITRDIAGEYLKQPEVADDFMNYLMLYHKYETVYQISTILEGKASESLTARFAGAPFDERISVISMLLSGLGTRFAAARDSKYLTDTLYAALREARDSSDPAAVLAKAAETARNALFTDSRGKTLSQDEKKRRETAAAELSDYSRLAGEAGFDQVKEKFRKHTDGKKKKDAACAQALEQTFAFLEQAGKVRSGEHLSGDTGSDLVYFVTELATNYLSMDFIRSHGSEAFYRYSSETADDRTRRELQQEISQLL